MKTWDQIKKIDKKFENKYLKLQIEADQNVKFWWERGDPDSYILSYKGKIVMEDFSKEEEGEEFIIGEFQVDFIDCYDPLSGEILYILDIIDCCSGDLVAAIEPLLAKEGDLQEEYKAADGILHISRLFLKPEFRGQKIGYMILPVLLNTICKNQNILVTIYPNPLNDMVDIDNITQEEIDLFKQTKEYQNALKKMVRFIEDFGFEHVLNTDTWIYKLGDLFDSHFIIGGS